MKPFDELTEAELLALNETDVQRYIDYACAEEGVPLLPDAAPVAPNAEAIADDLTAYEIQSGLLFTRREDAEKVCELLQAMQRGSTRYISGPSYRQAFEPDNFPVSITPRRLLSHEKAANLRAVIEKVEREKKAYETARTEYDNTAKARNNVAGGIYERIEEVKTRQARRETLMREYMRYLDLASGIKSIALRFLKSARPDAEELLPDLFAPEPAQTGRAYALTAYDASL